MVEVANLYAVHAELRRVAGGEHAIRSGLAKRTALALTLAFADLDQDTVDEMTTADVLAHLWDCAAESRPVDADLAERAMSALASCLDALAFDDLPRDAETVDELLSAFGV